MSLFVDGRKKVFNTLKETIHPNDKTIWFHCASLGEYEQGVPIMEKTKELFPDHKLIVTFFSPSGFEVKKNTTLANIVLYLPIDTVSNAKKFIELAHPSLAIFIKYEFWFNYIQTLYKQKIPIYFISVILRKEQYFFKIYGRWFAKQLQKVDHFFVQDTNTSDLLKSININDVTVRTRLLSLFCGFSIARHHQFQTFSIQTCPLSQPLIAAILLHQCIQLGPLRLDRYYEKFL